MPAFDPGAFDSGAFDTGGSEISVALIDQTAVLFAPIVAGPVDLPLIDQTVALFSPTIALAGQEISVALIDQTASSFTPTVTTANTISVGLISQTASPFTPTIIQQQFYTPALIDRTAVAHAPTVTSLATFAPALTNQTAAAFAPSMYQFLGIYPGTISNPATPFAPTVTGGFVYTPGPNNQPGESYVKIFYNNTDITDDVIVVGANFTTQVNGVPGTCQFRIKDAPHTRTLVVGKKLVLEINGQAVWTGYVSQVKRVYAFDAMNTSNPATVTRLFQVEGVDINILFRKRYVFNQATPTNMNGRKYSSDNTPDTTAYFDLIDDFLDLSGDHLDTSSLIENVGTINVDHPANPIGVGHDWGSSMRSITALSNGVYYIDPDRNVVLTDVDTPNAPFDLSDNPADDAVGYRDMEVLYNGSQMINDMLVWGAGAGSGSMVFSRETDSTSVSTHGRWQSGEFRTDMYKQGTVNRRADSIVQGSAQSKRGAKDDQVSVMCTVWEPGLRAAQKVDFTSDAFGFQDVLPIRRMTVTFVTSTKPRYQLMLGHEIDMPWGFFDIFRYDFDFPPINITIPGFDLPSIDIPEEGCTDDICGITDSFERLVGSGWGSTDAGTTWTFLDNGGGDPGFVSGGYAVIRNFFPSMETFIGTRVRPVIRWRAVLVTPAPAATYQMWFYGPVGGSDYVKVSFANAGVATLQMGTSGGSTSADPGFGAEVEHEIEVSFTATNCEVRVWDATSGTRPTTATIVRNYGPDSSGDVARVVVQNFASDATTELHLAYLDIGDVNRCTEYRLDNFTRTISAGSLGATQDGVPWTTLAGGTGMSVTGGQAVFTSSTFGTTHRSRWNNAESIDAPWWSGGAAQETSGIIRFKFGTVPTAAFSYIYLDFEVGNVELGIRVANGNGFGGWGLNGYSHAKSDWVADTWYIGEWVFDGTTTEVVVYEEGTTPSPGDWESGAVAPTHAALELEFGNQSTSGTSRSFTVDYIDFDYENKPCYPECGVTLVTEYDHFNRTVSLPFTNWGVSSGSLGWSFTEASTPDPTAVVEDGVGKMSIPTLTSGTNGTAINILNSSAPSNNQNSTDDWALSFRFRVTDQNLTMSTATPFLEFDYGRASFTIEMGVVASSTTGQGLEWFTLPNTIGVTSGSIRPWSVATGEWYSVLWEYVFGVRHRIKIWNDSDEEPVNWTVVAPVNTGSGTTRDFRIFLNQATDGTNTNSLAIELDDLRRVLIDCPGSEATSSETFPTSGRVCEEFTGDGTTTDFTMTMPMKYGSSSVSVDGVYQYYGSGYSDERDAEDELKIVSLVVPPANGAAIEICYTIDGGPEIPYRNL